MTRTMVKMFYDDDADLSVLTEKTIAVIGYGSQGVAQAKCLRDSGLKVILGLRSGGNSWKRGTTDGFAVYPIDEAAGEGDIIHLLIPDTAQPTVYRDQIRRHLTPGKTLCFSHGFNIHFKTITPPPDVDVVMVAPKGPGLSVRELYTKGFGVPALIAVQQDPSGTAQQTVLALAKALGATRAGVIETTFKDETESDLIGEQIVLVGGIMELIRNGFEVLVELGYPEELAYFEACNEAKLIIDQIYNNGMLGMLKAVSDTAKYGGLVVGPLVIDSHVRKNMVKAAKGVQSGRFAQQWLKEDEEGRPIFTAAMKEWETHPLERVGRVIRSMYGEKA